MGPTKTHIDWETLRRGDYETCSLKLWMILAAGVGCLFPTRIPTKIWAQWAPEHTPWKTRQPVRTRVNVGDHASGEPSAAVRFDGSGLVEG